MSGLISKANSQWSGWQPYSDALSPLPVVDDDAKDQLSRRAVRMIRRVETNRDIISAFGGLVYQETTILPLLGGGFLGPAKMPDGRVLKWGMWIPQHRALLDFFKRSLPPPAEQQARRAFADQHGVKYGVIEPGWACSVDDVLAWIKSEKKKGV